MGFESIAHEADGNQNAALIIDHSLDFTNDFQTSEGLTIFK